MRGLLCDECRVFSSGWEVPPGWLQLESDFHFCSWSCLAKYAASEAEPDEEPCPYTFSHTRHWCGYQSCRPN